MSAAPELNLVSRRASARQVAGPYEPTSRRGDAQRDSAPPVSSVTLKVPLPDVRLVESGRRDACTIEVVAARSRHVLSTVHQTLCYLDLRLTHTEVQVSGERIVQRLHVQEPDDASPSPARVLQALRALLSALDGLPGISGCGSPRGAGAA